jgi:hypothetical protein
LLFVIGRNCAAAAMASDEQKWQMENEEWLLLKIFPSLITSLS